MIVRCHNVQKYLKGRMKNDLDLSIILNQGASWKQARFVCNSKQHVYICCRTWNCSTEMNICVIVTES